MTSLTIILPISIISVAQNSIQEVQLLARPLQAGYTQQVMKALPSMATIGSGLKGTAILLTVSMLSGLMHLQFQNYSRQQMLFLQRGEFLTICRAIILKEQDSQY